MAMDNMQIRKKQLERLDEFVHELYKETQMLKQYGEDLPDLEGLYLHIHDVIQDLLSVPTTAEFMKKIEEFHKGIAGVIVIIGAGDPQQVAEELKKAQQGMSDVDVEDFLKNMKVKEKSNYKPQSKPDPEPKPTKEQTAEERDAEKEELIDTLDLKEQVSTAKPKERNWDNQPATDNGEDDTVAKADDSEEANDPLSKLWDEWNKN